jgi:hypothetical protein
MEQNALLRVIGTMRQQLLAENSDIDPMPQKSREHMDTLLGNDRRLDRYVQVSWFGTDDSFGTAVVHLVNTARTLKYVLRHTDNLWKELHGEIDFDDLMVATILRFTAGDAHDFILRRIDTLRMAARDTTSESSKAAAETQRQEIQADWNETTKKAIEWDAAAAKTLILFLFPNAARCFGDERHVDMRVNPQGVQHWEPTNYWDRMLAGELAPTEIRDQTVLRAMREWSESPSNSTLANDLCLSSRFVQIWEYFANWVPVPDLLDLASQVLDHIRGRDGAKASSGERHEAVIALWRLAHKEKCENGQDWLLDQIGRSMAISLHLVNDLYYYWASIHYGVVATEQDRNAIRQGLVEQAKHMLTTDGEDTLIRILNPEYPYSVYQLVCPPDQNEPPSVLTQPSDWQWLSPILLAAAARAPIQIIPEIVSLVTDSDYRGAGEFHARWNATLLEGIFAADVRRVMEILSTDFQVASLTCDAVAQLKVQNTRELARQWLNEHSNEASEQ